MFDAPIASNRGNFLDTPLSSSFDTHWSRFAIWKGSARMLPEDREMKNVCPNDDENVSRNPAATHGAFSERNLKAVTQDRLLLPGQR